MTRTHLYYLLLCAVTLAIRPVNAQTASTDIKVTSSGTARSPIPGNFCTLPPSETNFLTTDKAVWVVFTYTGGQAGDNGYVEWFNPSGQVYLTSTITQAATGGNYCYAYYISIYGYTPASQPGNWRVRLRWNSTEVFSQPFNIASPSTSSLTLLTNTLLPQAVQGAPYSVTLSATGGVAPYSWSFSKGAAPPGLTLSPSGIISGVASQAGSYLMTLHVADSAGATLDRDIALPVAAPYFNTNVGSLSFSYTQGSALPAPQPVAVTSTGSNFSFTSLPSANWITASPASAQTPTTVSIGIAPEGLAPGSYQGSVSLYSAAANAFLSLPVNLAVFPSGTPSIGGIINTTVGTDWTFTIPGGLGTAAPLGWVYNLGEDSAGNIYAADSYNNVVVQYIPSGTASVVAGNGVGGYSGDGGAAVNASLNGPHGAVMDAAGNLYIADSGNNRIRKVATDGTITTVAGTGQQGFAGDGGAAVSALLSYPASITLDASGNVFFYDAGNYRIRRLGTDGSISTVGGNGKSGYSGEGPALQVAIDLTNGLALDQAGNLYFGDNQSHLRRLTVTGQTALVAGTGTPGYSGDNGPAINAQLRFVGGLAVDSAGNLYFSDFNNGRIRKIDRNGIITTYAGSGKVVTSGDGGPALNAGMNPEGLTFDNRGNLFLSDIPSFTIRRIDSTQTITKAMGNGQFRNVPDGTLAINAFLYYPGGVALDANRNLIVADTSSHRIRKVTSNGVFSTIAGTGTSGLLGDGGPATAGWLDYPLSVALDAAGNIYFADDGNSRIREISTTGVISTFAGAGSFSTGGEYSGDGGAATAAYLSYPHGLAFDKSGNLYIADTGNNVIRRVGTNGTISTVVGNGKVGFSGDGGPATAAELDNPVGVSFDASGNLYIADYYNNSIRMVTPGGVISTFAGNQIYGSTGDGGPATKASLKYPGGVLFDAAGDAYISESAGDRIRRVTPGGIITTVAGTGTGGFGGDGGPSTSALLNYPSGSMAIDPNGTLYFTDSDNHRVRAIQFSAAAAPSLTASPSSLSFTALSGGTSTNKVEVAVSSSSFGLPFQAAAVTASGGGWLQIDTVMGVSPASVGVSANPSGLSPGVYQGTITFASPYANPPQVNLAVTFTVSAPASGHLGIDSTPLSFSLVVGSPPASTQVLIRNTGSGSIGYSSSTSTSSGGSWLSATPSSGTISASSPGAMAVTVTPGPLTAGVYSGAVTIGSPDTLDPPVTIPVVMAIGNPASTILLSQTGLTFQAVQGGGNPLAQSIAILNTGQGSMAWTAAAQPLSGSGWLSLSQTTGTVPVPYVTYSTVNVSIDVSTLSAGNYFGQILFRAANASNSPQAVSVVVNVLPPGSPLGPEVRPSGLVFIGTATSAIGSQAVGIADRGTATTGFNSTDLTYSGVNWLSHIPAVGSVQVNSPTQITVLPNFSARQPGIDRGLIPIIFADGSSQTLSVLSVVPPPSVGASLQSNGVKPRSASGCTPGSLVLESTTFSSANTTVLALSQPATLEVQVADNCGNPITSGTVVATFSNQDPRINLVHIGNGNWSKTWTPVTASATPVTVQFNAFFGQGTQLLAGAQSVQVILQSGASGPLTVGTANAASGVGTFIAPGGLVSIYGQDLSTAAVTSGNPPFPTQLNSTQVLIGGEALPLRYVGNGQVNAQVPFDVSPNTTQHLWVQRGNTVSVAQDVTVAAAQPAVYTVDQAGIYGSGVGVIVDGNTNVQVTTATPAHVGDVVVIYCNGLGDVNPPVPTGTAAPLSGSLSRTINPVTVMIGGLQSTVNFAGLTPGYPDLYQVNAVIPAGVTTGNQVPVVVTVSPAGSGALSSPPVTMAVQ